MLIFQFIESEYKCPVYDDSNLFVVLDSSAFIVNVTDKSLIMHNVLLASEAGFTKGGPSAGSEALSSPTSAQLNQSYNLRWHLNSSDIIV